MGVGLWELLVNESGFSLIFLPWIIQHRRMLVYVQEVQKRMELKKTASEKAEGVQDGGKSVPLEAQL